MYLVQFHTAHHNFLIFLLLLQENERDSTKKFPSKSCPLRYGTGKIQEDAMKLFESGLHEFLESQNTGWSITSLSVTASKIFDIPSVCL
jgi:DNA polymerase eta